MPTQQDTDLNLTLAAMDARPTTTLTTTVGTIQVTTLIIVDTRLTMRKFKFVDASSSFTSVAVDAKLAITLASMSTTRNNVCKVCPRGKEPATALTTVDARLITMLVAVNVRQIKALDPLDEKKSSGPSS